MMIASGAPTRVARHRKDIYYASRRLFGPMRRRRLLVATSVNIALTAISAFFLLPFLWIAVSAFKPTQDIVTTNPLSLHGFSLQNFRSLFTSVPVAVYFRNSLIYSLGSTIGAVISTALAGYAFGRCPARLKGVWLGALLVTLAVPFVGTILAQYIMFVHLGLVNTFAPLIAPAWFAAGSTSLFVILMRQFFASLPRELEDAGRVDGCRPWQLFRHVFLPLVRPAVVTVALFQFVFSWNDFFAPLVYLNSASLYTIPLGVSTFSGQYGLDIGPLVAMSLISIAPLLLLYVTFQRYFVNTLLRSGIQG
jgi:multiple sugar transport system permease protein